MAPQAHEFLQRQITSLEGLEDPLSVDIRQSWEWLASELGPAPLQSPAAHVVRGAQREGAASAAEGGAAT